jgi:integrase/predicted transcriptional regulator
MRKTYQYRGQTIKRLPTGRFQIRIKDAAGKLYRPAFATLDEAKAGIQQFLERQARGERFLSTAAHTTFGEACELRIQHQIHKGCAVSTIEQARDILRREFADFAPQSLSWFVDDRMQAVKQWLTEKKDKGYSAALLSVVRKEMKRAFDAAIEEGKMAPPNPMTAYGVSLPFVETVRRQPLSIDDITALVDAAHKRRSREPELVFEARFVMTILGLSIPLRDQDLCGLCWDCVDLDGRRVYLHRKVARIATVRGTLPRGQASKRFALVEGTKTGEAGKGECHMSPVLHAVLTRWRDLLRERGFPISGRVPVIRTSESAILNTCTVSASHVDALMQKAGLVSETGAKKYTRYNLRHTVPSMWRAVGMDLDEIKDRMRHLKLETTEVYRHRVPEYVKVLRPQVEDVIDGLDLQRTADGIIDALSVVLVQMWRRAGIVIPCSPPTTMRQKRLPDYRTADAEPVALNGIVIDGTVTIAESRPTPMQQLRLSPTQMAELRRAEARRLRAPPNNWSKTRIAEHLGLSDSIVNKYLAFEPDEPLMSMRKLRADKMREVQGQIAAMLDAGRNTRQIADVLNLKRSVVATFARRRGTPVKYHRAPPKLAQHEAAIRRWNAEGKSNYAIGKALGFGTTTIDACMKRLGLKAAGAHKRRPRTELALSGTSDEG